MINNKSIKVLLIEDNPGDARLIREIFSGVKGARFDLKVADGLSAGLEFLASAEIHVILLDLNLPDSQGLDTLIKVCAQFPAVPTVVLTSLADEVLGVNAVKEGAQDYLVKDQIDSSILWRVMRYAIERNQLLLEQARRREQEKRERAEEVRDYQHYRAISQGELSVDLSALSHPDEKAMDRLTSYYKEIVISYVRAVQIQEDRPAEHVREFAHRLAAIRARARDAVRLHLRVLDEFSQRATPVEERAFSNDARLVLVELLGNLMDIYLSTSKITRKAKDHPE